MWLFSRGNYFCNLRKHNEFVIVKSCGNVSVFDSKCSIFQYTEDVFDSVNYSSIGFGNCSDSVVLKKKRKSWILYMGEFSVFKY
jgi:hypothetical protein